MLRSGRAGAILFGIAVGLAFLAIAVAVALSQRATNAAFYAERLDEAAREIENDVANHFRLFQYGLRGAAGAIAAAGPRTMSRRQFEAYYAVRDLPTEFPGARGIGFIERVPAAAVAVFGEQVGADGFPAYRLRELAPNGGERFIIKYIYPLAENGGATGLDIASEANRRAAALAAEAGRTVRLTAPITLVQASGKEGQGFLILYPVHHPDDREGPAVGWAYSPLVADEIIGQADVTDLVAFAIADVAAGQVIFQGRGFDRAAAFARSGIDVFGRQWEFRFQPGPGLLRTPPPRQPVITFIAIATAGLLAGIAAWAAANWRTAVQARRWRESRFASQTIRALPEAVFVLDGMGRISRANSGADVLLGLRRETLRIRPFSSLFPAGTAVDTRGVPVSAEEVVRADGSRVPVALRTAPLVIAGEHYTVASLTDRTAEVAALDAARESERHWQAVAEARTAALDRALRDLRSIVNALPVMIAYWDRELVNGFANEAYEKWLGVEPGGALGRRLADLAGPAMVERNRVYIDAVLRGEPQRFERERPSPDGGTRLLLNQFLPDLQDNEVAGFYVLVTDVTDLKAAEAAEKAAREAAEAATRAKSTFLTSMSHELRTPMNAILGFVDLLEGRFSGELTGTQADYIAVIRSSAEHLLKLMNEVLELSKIEAGRMNMALEPVFVVSAIRSALATLRPLAEQRQVRIAVDVGGAHDIAAIADLTRLAQVLINLGSNAIKYNRPDGWVRMSVARTDDGEVRISVADNGLGIPSARHDEVFQPFNRLGAEGGSIEGTGVGLALVRNLVALMGGRIDFTSEEGVGSTFNVTLQAADPPAAEEPVANAVPVVGQRTARPMRVLYVEDNEANLLVLRNYAKVAQNIDLREARTGAEGLEMVLAERPDLAFLDINLPGLSGYEVLRAIRRDDWGSTAKVVALTAHAMEGEREKGLEAGFDEYLAKPLRLPAFLEIIARFRPGAGPDRAQPPA